MVLKNMRSAKHTCAPRGKKTFRRMVNILLTQNLPVENQQISISYAVDMSTEWVKENKVAKKQAG